MAYLYDVTVPTLSNIIKTTKSILKKGETWAKEYNVSTSDLLSFKIYDDMFPLTIQILIIMNVSKKTMERLTGIMHPDIDIGDKSIEELYKLLDDTLRELESVKKEDVDDRGTQDPIVPCDFFYKDYEASLVEYVHGYAIPTVYFHLSIAYAIMRGQGVPLGKWDYQTEFFRPFKLVG